MEWWIYFRWARTFEHLTRDLREARIPAVASLRIQLVKQITQLQFSRLIKSIKNIKENLRNIAKYKNHPFSNSEKYIPFSCFLFAEITVNTKIIEKRNSNPYDKAQKHIYSQGVKLTKERFFLPSQKFNSISSSIRSFIFQASAFSSVFEFLNILLLCFSMAN